MKTEFKSIIILFCSKLREILSEESLQKTCEFLESPEALNFQSSKVYWDFKAEIMSGADLSKLKRHSSEEIYFCLVIEVFPSLMRLWKIAELDKIYDFFRLHKMNAKLALREANSLGKLEEIAKECIKTIALTFDEYQMYEAIKSASCKHEFLALCASEKLNKARVEELTDVLDDVLSLLPDGLLGEAERNLDVKRMMEKRRCIDRYSYSTSEIDIEEVKRSSSVEFYGNLIALVKVYREILKDNPME